MGSWLVCRRDNARWRIILSDHRFWLPPRIWPQPIVNIDFKQVGDPQRIAKNLGTTTVQKGLCYIALTLSVVVFIFFLLDIVLGLLGMAQTAPFKYASLLTDIVFLVSSATLGLLSFQTLREQV